MALMPIRHRSEQYIITFPMKGSFPSLLEVLADYKFVKILNSPDHSTVLVEMSPWTKNKVADDHPELTIEPNSLLLKLNTTAEVNTDVGAKMEPLRL